MKHVELKGVIVPMITPVDDEDRVDELAYRQVIRRLIQAGVHGLFAGGTAGEGPLLTDHEWQRMMEIAADETGDKLPLLGGVMDSSTRRIQAKIKALAAIGYAHCVVTPSYYVALNSPSEHLRLFDACAESGSGMAMIAYNIPSCTGSEIPVEVLCELARRGLIHTCKNSSRDFAYFQRLVTRAAPLGLRILMGEESYISSGLLAGACGIVPVNANVDPGTYVRAYQAAMKPDLDELARNQERISVLRANITSAGSCWIAGVKSAVAAIGIGSGKPVSPLEPLNADQQQKLRKFVETELAKPAE